MIYLFYLLLAGFFLGGLAWLFVATPAASLARILAVGIPAVLVTVGGLLTLIGRGAIGIPLIGGGVLLWQRMRNVKPLPAGGRKSHVRSAALEMELDLDTGEMDGSVLAGAFEGQLLSTLEEHELLELYHGLTEDGESASLLEAYLDRRMPGWREDADAHTGDRQAGAASSGPMTKEEAYKILGLEPGASASDINKAWRKLMKSVHPDSGGTEFLAAKINEAKDVLLN